ncbi:hydroxyacid dehydrogenase [Nonomuraea sp. MG754425]|uniref:NAD(P)-dependent oxidoreductase n=1 Tax=Nonomuraea sp. MG754425 TaxID=2570319 RepID=UPI001F3CC585|nr:NAD(P)-dependent oxidoreductase [Nonomuraea sp. MG754425]MCF6473914.1 hydroxyacid dehydrogenase [Nonomuraea sp. MG754425]
MTVAVHVGPEPVPALIDAVRRAGGRVVPLAEAEAIVYYGNDDPGELRSMLHEGISWVQLPHAGVERWADAGVITEHPVFTAATGSYGGPVAEHALALMLAAARELPRAAVLPRARYRDALPEADYVVVAAPATPGTRGMFGAYEFGLMKPDAWLVNVARGGLVVTGDLVEALRAGRIGGAALDVTDPEPLPDGHPLWSLENVLITPHSANPRPAYWRGLAERVTANVRRFADGEPLEGVVSPARGF